VISGRDRRYRRHAVMHVAADLRRHTAAQENTPTIANTVGSIVRVNQQKNPLRGPRFCSSCSYNSRMSINA